MNVKQYTDENNISYVDVNGVIGHLYPGDVDVFRMLVPKSGKYVETGSYLGCSATLVSLLSDDILVYCHDIWEEDMANLTQESGLPKVVDNYFYKFYENVIKNKMCNRIIPIRGDSRYTIGIHEDESIDLAFIDGDHSYQGVMNDLKAIYPKVKPGCTILCHDSPLNSESMRAIRDFLNDDTRITCYNFTNMISFVKPYPR